MAKWVLNTKHFLDACTRSRGTSTRPVAKWTNGGAEEDRTPDLLRARQALSQLSYGPIMQGQH
jgi:hypothetical protein